MPTYSYDPSGLNSENLVRSEQHQITSPQRTEQGSFFVAEYAPFFKESVVIRTTPDTTGRTLVEGTDYFIAHDFVAMSQILNRPIAGSIVLVDITFEGSLYITYQTVGGDQVTNSASDLETLIRKNAGIFSGTWDQITDRPNNFPTQYHEHQTSNFKGMDDVVQTLNTIRLAIANRPGGVNAADFALLNDVIQAHISGNSAAHTRDQVGLSQLNNYPMATPEEAILGLPNRYLSPATALILIQQMNVASGGSYALGISYVDVSDQYFTDTEYTSDSDTVIKYHNVIGNGFDVMRLFIDDVLIQEHAGTSSTKITLSFLVPPLTRFRVETEGSGLLFNWSALQ